MKDPRGAGRCCELDVERLGKLLESFDGVQLLVVGDAMLDEYLWGEAQRISPEAPVPVVRVERDSVVLGGAANVVRNVVALGGRCRFAGVVGEDLDGERVRELLSLQGVVNDGVVVDPGRVTTRKARVVASGQQVVRFDRETARPISAEVAAALLDASHRFLRDLDGVILADYGKGVLTGSFTRALLKGFAEAGVPVAVDPKGDFSRYRGVSLLKPNGNEARGIVESPTAEASGPESLAQQIRKEVGEIPIAVTEGRRGMVVFEGSRPGIPVPTLTREVFDVQGAGDTAMAALWLAVRVGASLVEAALLANVAAGVVVEKMGTATATRNEVRGRLADAVAWAREAG